MKRQKFIYMLLFSSIMIIASCSVSPTSGEINSDEHGYKSNQDIKVSIVSLNNPSLTTLDTIKINIQNSTQTGLIMDSKNNLSVWEYDNSIGGWLEIPYLDVNSSENGVEESKEVLQPDEAKSYFIYPQIRKRYSQHTLLVEFKAIIEKSSLTSPMVGNYMLITLQEPKDIYYRSASVSYSIQHAIEKATDWREDAYLGYIKVYFLNSADLDSPLITYLFQSPSEPGVDYGLTLNPKGIWSDFTTRYTDTPIIYAPVSWHEEFIDTVGIIQILQQYDQSIRWPTDQCSILEFYGNDNNIPTWSYVTGKDCVAGPLIRRFYVSPATGKIME